jgi:hypothetical protein
MLKSKRFCNPVSVEFENMTKLAGYKTDQRIIICMTQVKVGNTTGLCGVRHRWMVGVRSPG